MQRQDDRLNAAATIMAGLIASPETCDWDNSKLVDVTVSLTDGLIARLGAAHGRGKDGHNNAAGRGTVDGKANQGGGAGSTPDKGNGGGTGTSEKPSESSNVRPAEDGRGNR